MKVDIIAIMLPIAVAVGVTIMFWKIEKHKRKEHEEKQARLDEEIKRPRRIFDYTKNYWGHACSMDATNDTWPFTYRGHFFYSSPMVFVRPGEDIRMPIFPHVGDFIATKGKQSPVVFTKITQLERKRDPNDMYSFNGISAQSRQEIEEFADMEDATTYEFIKLIERLESEQKETV